MHIQKAIELLHGLFKAQQKTWPRDMYILVEVGVLKDIIALLGDELEDNTNQLGMREKDV
jgi:hypothetical protein